MDTFNIVLQVILCLSILVVLHEGGHFFPAKWFGMRVEKFYLFFDPWFSLFKKKKGDTEYGIGWIPFGGYVKIAGMIDESMDKEQMKGPVQDWEFRAKPAWQRLIVMVGGVFVNFVLGFLLYAMIAMVWGKTFITTENAKYGIAPGSIGIEAGLQDGDKVLKVGDLDLERFNSGLVSQEIILNDANSLIIERNNQTRKIDISTDIREKLKESQGSDFFELRTPFEIAKVNKGSEAEKAGLTPNSKIISVNNEPVSFFHEFGKKLAANKDKSVLLHYVNESGDTLSGNAVVSENGTIGFYTHNEKSRYFEVSTEKLGLLQALPHGVKEGVDFLALQIKAFKKMFTGELSAKKNLGSIISIAKYFDSGWDWKQFWTITAMLSIILAFFNILPIPALDGGYVVFLLYEIISGKAPSDRFMEIVNVIGFIILISLMIFALGLDISRLF